MAIYRSPEILSERRPIPFTKLKPTAMKAQKPILLIIAALAAFSLSGCTVSVRSGKSLPPGQAKKITGEQSAAPYAPGHNK